MSDVIEEGLEGVVSKLASLEATAISRTKTTEKLTGENSAWAKLSFASQQALTCPNKHASANGLVDGLSDAASKAWGGFKVMHPSIQAAISGGAVGGLYGFGSAAMSNNKRENDRKWTRGLQGVLGGGAIGGGLGLAYQSASEMQKQWANNETPPIPDLKEGDTPPGLEYVPQATRDSYEESMTGPINAAVRASAGASPELDEFLPNSSGAAGAAAGFGVGLIGDRRAASTADLLNLKSNIGEYINKERDLLSKALTPQARQEHLVAIKRLQAYQNAGSATGLAAKAKGLAASAVSGRGASSVSHLRSLLGGNRGEGKVKTPSGTKFRHGPTAAGKILNQELGGIQRARAALPASTKLLAKSTSVPRAIALSILAGLGADYAVRPKPESYYQDLFNFSRKPE